MHDRTIICLASNYHFDPTSKHHVMNELARTNDVLWVNWHGSRRPTLARHDLSSIVEKFKQFHNGLERARQRLWVLTPMVVPLPASRLARRLNQHLLVKQIRAALAKMPRRRRQLWLFCPDVEFLAGAFGEEALIYYCVDEFSEFTGYDKETVGRQDQRLCEVADLVLATSQPLFDARQGYNPNTMLMRHGVEHGHFARALEPDLPVAAELESIPRPRVGFFGLVNDWIDLELVAAVARRRPEWSFIFLGRLEVPTAPFAELRNMHFLGRKPYRDLPGYCRGFDAATIPMKINRLTHNVNPIKLREYLAAGLPVVTTPLPEAQLNNEGVFSAASPDEFERSLEIALTRNGHEHRRRHSESVRHEGWPSKVTMITGALKQVLKEKLLTRSLRTPAGARLRVPA
jgi:hypothetical protein